MQANICSSLRLVKGPFSGEQDIHTYTYEHEHGATIALSSQSFFCRYFKDSSKLFCPVPAVAAAAAQLELHFLLGPCLAMTKPSHEWPRCRESRTKSWNSINLPGWIRPQKIMLQHFFYHGKKWRKRCKNNFFAHWGGGWFRWPCLEVDQPRWGLCISIHSCKCLEPDQLQ